jgi:predicted TIM-barrel fold metal-dependent hydrolase
MNTMQAVSSARYGIVDCDIHPVLRDPHSLDPYLPKQWREFLHTYGPHPRAPFPNASAHPKITPALARRDSWPSNGPPGSDLDFMRQQHLDLLGIEYGMLLPMFPSPQNERNLDFASAIACAVNDWTLHEWADADSRLRASIVVPIEDPDAAAKEIQRRGETSKFVQVYLTTRTVEPFGRKKYWPIFSAAESAGIPLCIHTGGQNGFPMTGGGTPSFYLEEHHGFALATQATLTSLVMEGVFDKFPGLKVVLVEAGFAWAPTLAWRLDAQWKRMRHELPGVKRPPSEYIREHVWFTTQPVEEPERVEDIRSILEWIGWDRVMFSTDYPHWDSDDPRYAFKIRMSDVERRGIFRDNAMNFYGLS